MTRARDTLSLSGCISQKKWDELWTKPAAVTPLAIVSARSFADWLGLWFANRVQIPNFKFRGGTEGELPDLRWRMVDDAELTGDDKAEGGRRKAEIHLPAPDAATVKKLRARLEWNYPFAAATRRKAKSSVTELRRAAEEFEEESEQVFRFQFSAKWRAGTPAPPSQNRKAENGKRKLSAAEAGTAHHKFLQHFALEGAGGLAALEAEARRLERENILSADERAVLDLAALAAVWSSPPGGKIRAQPPDAVRRELPFTARFSPAELAEIAGAQPEAGLENEFVVVQGVADLVVLLPGEIWLVDFKTDQVRADELPEKARLYQPQLELYARALERIYSRPVTSRWLHFLAARKTVDEEI